MNTLKQYYIDLFNLKYSEKNIANNIIKFLKSKNPSRKTNKALHFVTLTKEREFKNFKIKPLKDPGRCFKEAKSNLMSDLTHYCVEYWDPIKDPWDRNTKPGTKPGFCSHRIRIHSLIFTISNTLLQ